MLFYKILFLRIDNWSPFCIMPQIYEFHKAIDRSMFWALPLFSMLCF